MQNDTSSSDDSPVQFPSRSPSTDEEKRERQRLHVRRSYYRKLNRLNGMRDEIEQLEEQYERLIQVRRQQDVDESAVHCLNSLPTRKETLANLYRHLATLKDELRRENIALEGLLKEHMRFTRSIERFRVEEEEDKMDAGVLDEGVELVPLSVDECHKVVRDAYQEIQRFTKSHSYVTSGQQVFGWRDRRQVVDDQVRFIITKVFRGRDAEELTDRAWQLTTTAKGIQELYSSTMNMALQRLQVVDDDNVVIYRTISNPTKTLRVKSLFLASRFRVESGYILLYRSIDPKRLVTPADALADKFHKETWLEMFTWNMLEFTGEDGADCRSSCGGVVPSTTAASPHVWMLEVLLLAVRWESKVVGHLFSLKE